MLATLQLLEQIARLARLQHRHCRKPMSQDYYLRRAGDVKDDSDACRQFLEVAVEISPENSSALWMVRQCVDGRLPRCDCTSFGQLR